MVLFYSIITISIFLYLIFEYLKLSTSIKKISIRIIINGTRGKSTTVKLLYEILKKNGLTVFAKITGDDPILLKPDGSLKLIKRFSPPSIKENIKLLIDISKTKPDAIIMECMALHSENQSILGKVILKPNYTIITNILPDHKEIMGTSIEENTLTILQCVHPESTLIITEQVSNQLQDINLKTKNIEICKSIELSYNNINNIPYSIVKESWEVIEKLVQLIGIDIQIAKKRFLKEWELISKKIKLNIHENSVTVWNLFSVNDVRTFHKFVKYLQNSTEEENIIFIFNTRIDRPLRTKEFVDYISEHYSNSRIWLFGDGKYLARKFFIQNNFIVDNLLLTTQKGIILMLKNKLLQNSILYCIGNHKKTELLTSKFKELSNSKKEII